MLDIDGLDAASRRLGDAVIAPSMWPQLMEEISRAVGATGAALLQGDVRTADVPMTPSVSEYFQNYFENNLHVSDVRALRGVPLLMAGRPVIVDEDIFSSEREMLRDPLYANLGHFGLRWFAGVGFRVGSALWGLTIQRSLREGPFGMAEVKALGQLSLRLTETASLSSAVGRLVLSGISNALHLVQQPAVAMDRFGFVIETNLDADSMLDNEIRIRNRRLSFLDRNAQSDLDRTIDQIRNTPDFAALPAGPIVVRRRTRRPIVIRFLPVDGAARSPFLGARAILVLTDLERRSKPDAALLASAFELTPAQAHLAALLTTGQALEEVATELGITFETARNHLKTVFAKTGTHRQGELIALLSQL